MEPNKPVSLKSSFGAISVRETIYPNTIQDALLTSRAESQQQQHKTDRTYSANEHIVEGVSVLPANNAGLTAHLVSTTIYRNSPQLRILFQSSTVSSSSQTTSPLDDLERKDQADHSEHLDQSSTTTANPNSNSTNSAAEQHHLCAIAVVKLNSLESDSSKIKNDEQFKPLIASCALNKEGVCISQITIPANWWPAITLDAATNTNNEQQTKPQQQNKQQQQAQASKPAGAEVFYTVVYSDKCGENVAQAHHKKVAVSPTDAMSNLNLQHNNLHLESVNKIQLKPFDGVYEELTNDDIIRILIPQKPVHAKTRLHIPVCYRYHRNYPLFAFALRIRVKPGMRVLGAKLARKTQPSTSNLQPLANSATRSSKRKQNRLLNEYKKLNSAQNWEISIESNSKQTQATITAFLKLNSKDQLVNEENNKKTKSDDNDGEDNDEDDDLDDDLEEFDEDLMNLMPSTCNEVYTILLEVDAKALEYSDAGRIVWQLLYLTDLENSNQEEMTNRKLHHHLKRDFDRESSKLTSKLDIQKDEIESVVALTRNRNLLNTAVLSGKQNMQSLRIYAVSSSGKFGDVTLQASCSSTDETVLKVTPSCTALLLDGSETRSSINATIQIHYGVYTGLASFQVWMPKLPLELDVSDDQLSAIYSWKIPHIKQQSSSHGTSASGASNHHRLHSKLLTPHSHHSTNHQNKHHNHHKHGDSKMTLSDGQASTAHTDTAEIGCRLRYQQAYIESYAKFIIADENSGREWSFINRKYSFRVTDLILPHLHLSDNRLAIIRSNTIEGLNLGLVELKILSPITGKQLASKKLRISNDQVTIAGLHARLLTGLQMQIKPEHTILDQSSFGHSSGSGSNSLSNPQITVWSVRTNENSALTTQYQEGLLDIEIKFSDGKLISLSDITDSDYHLQIDSGNPSMIAYADGLSASLPRIIALKSGKNIKLDVTLQASLQCIKKTTLPLKQQTVYLNVNLNNQQKANKNVQQAHSQLDNDAKLKNKQEQQISAEHLESNHLQNDANDESGSMLPTAQVHSQFQSLYNSQLSVSQRNKLVRPLESRSASWNGVEIGVYTVLCVLGLLMAAFTTGCFVYGIKQKASHNSPEFTTVTTVKQNDQDPDYQAGNSHFLNNNALRLNKMLNDWSWLQHATKFNSSKRTRGEEEEENPISYDRNGNPIIQSKVNIRSNPFDEDTDNQEADALEKNVAIENKNRQSLISYPGSEISIQITANPIVNAFENVTSVLKRSDDKNKKLQEEPCTPEPDLEEIKNMLNYCKSIPPATSNAISNTTKLTTNNNVSNSKLTSLLHKQPPPPIPPRRLQQANSTSATFVRGKRTPNQQLPVHIPGIACRTLNADNISNNNKTNNKTNKINHNNSSSSTNSSCPNSVNNSPNKNSSSNLSPSLSLTSTDSGILANESPTATEKHLVTNPFLLAANTDEENDLNETINQEDEQVYINTNAPPVPKHNNDASTNLTINRQRTRIIPPKSLFEEMNYNEIVNYIENMEESTA